jgi:uncharacterized membrane protein YjgN (DUF898 family)
MKIHFNSIKLKLTVFYTVILVLLLIAFHFIAYMLFASGLHNNLDSSVRAYSEKARDAILQVKIVMIYFLYNGIKRLFG